jgi:hypothetical protein
VWNYQSGNVFSKSVTYDVCAPNSCLIFASEYLVFKATSAPCNPTYVGGPVSYAWGGQFTLENVYGSSIITGRWSP